MPTPDWPALAKLLVDSDLLARQALSDPSSEHAAPRLRSWSGVVQAAATLWPVLPPAITPSEGDVDVMARLAGVGAGIGRSVAGSRWPGPGVGDERFDTLRGYLTQAAASTRLPARRGRSNWAVAAEDARRQVVHLLYVVTHATAVALRNEVAQSRLEVRWQPKKPARPEAAALPTAQAVVNRLNVCEQLAGRYLHDHSSQSRRMAPSRPSSWSALRTALDRWDAQAHRTLLTQPDMPDLVRIARVQALIGATTSVIATSVSSRTPAAELADRLAQHATRAETAWTALAQQASRLVGPDGTTDPALIRAAAETRAAIKATAWTSTGWAEPEQIARRVDLPQTVTALQQAMTASLDVAYLTQDLVRHGQLTVPARTAAAQTTRGVLALDLGPAPAPVVLPLADRHQLAVNERLPLPAILRKELFAATREAASNAAKAATVPNLYPQPPTAPAPRPAASPRPHARGRAPTRPPRARQVEGPPR